MSNAQANVTFSDPVARSGICVVIPARNEETLIGRCVASVLDAGLDAAHVYAIDDASTDRTGEVLSGFSLALTEETTAP